jgi:hypothetical protein
VRETVGRLKADIGFEDTLRTVLNDPDRPGVLAGQPGIIARLDAIERWMQDHDADKRASDEDEVQTLRVRVADLESALEARRSAAEPVPSEDLPKISPPALALPASVSATPGAADQTEVPAVAGVGQGTATTS